MTPRQISAWLEFANQRIQREQLVSLVQQTLAARGADKDLKSEMDRLLKPLPRS